MTTRYDYKLGRDIRPGATVPSPCEHERRDNCYWCTRAELERVKAENERLKSQTVVRNFNNNSFM